MAKYIQLELNNGLLPDGTRFISDSAVLARRKPQTEMGGGTRYALGWLVRTLQGMDEVQHSGSTENYTSSLTFYPEKKLGVVLLSNGSGGPVMDAIEKRIMEFWFEAPQGADIAIKNLSTKADQHDDLSFIDEEYQSISEADGFPLSKNQKKTLTAMIGTYHNEYTGDIRLVKIKGTFVLQGRKTIAAAIRSANKDGGDDFTLSGARFKIQGNKILVRGLRDEFDYPFMPVSRQGTHHADKTKVFDQPIQLKLNPKSKQTLEKIKGEINEEYGFLLGSPRINRGPCKSCKFKSNAGLMHTWD